MSRISTCFEALQQSQRKALVPYLVAGDSDPSVTVTFMHELVAAGADVIELGIPFSDPMAEGPVIQRAHERALEHNVSLTDCLAMVAEFRKQDATTPVVLMGYANPVEVMGYNAFAEKAAAAGVDGVLTVDMPPEEAEEFGQVMATKAIDVIYLIAPTTTPERAQTICNNATGYIYYVSLKGVTGAAHLDPAAVAAKISELRGYTALPLCVGFGISTPEAADTISAVADGVVVGSALVKQFDNNTPAAEAQNTAASLVAAMRTAMDNSKGE